MQLDIGGLREEVGAGRGFRLQENFPPEFVATPAGRVTGLVEVEGRVRHLNPTLLVEGEIRAEAAFTCSRCLVSFKAPLHIPYAQEFVPVSRLDQINPEERDEVRTFEGDTLDLTGSVAEAMLLDFPVKPLCREDCRGLCPQCGQDLNQGPCECSQEPVDPRLEVLGKLLGEKERKEGHR